MVKPIVSPEILHRLLLPDYEAGLLTWKSRTADMFAGSHKVAEGNCKSWNARRADKPAFHRVHTNGYLCGIIYGRRYYAHRVIWAMHTGVWPNEIDHLNHDRANNRIKNLREVSHKENSRNQSISISNKSGVTGIHWHVECCKWLANITVNYKTIHLGLFVEKDDAIAARKAAEIEYGFHPQHGEK